MRVVVTTYGERLLSDYPERRKFFVTAVAVDTWRAKLLNPSDAVTMLENAISMIKSFPRSSGGWWVSMEKCVHCRSRHEWAISHGLGTGKDMWFWSFCERHVVVKSLKDVIDAIDNKRRIYEIDFAKKKVSAHVYTWKHAYTIILTPCKAIAVHRNRDTGRRNVFTYNNYHADYASSYAMLATGVAELLSRVKKTLEAPPTGFTVHLNGEELGS